MPHNLDAIDFPRYEWCDLSIYRNYNGYQLVPIIASRGCRWSRCTFCAERFYWRIRSAKNFVDELEWLVNQGCTLFMFNESDLNGQPDKVLEICDEIISRGLKVKLTGQLRIHKKSNRAYFQKLREAGFVALRFGVDAFSENTLRLQMKGYTTEIVSQNLKDCWEAGIYTEVNWVIGIPGETDADCEEGVQLILKNREYIGRLANINPLILVNGGVYWIDPDAHNIHFRQPKDELYGLFPRALPADSWYSLEPYIDAQVRKQRFETIVLKLYDAGFPVGSWATRVIDDVRSARDKMRAGGGIYIDESVKPALLKTLSNHRVYHYKDKYYAVPVALGEPDFANQDVSLLPGVIVDSSEAALIAEIELSSEWANSRGHYEVQKSAERAASATVVQDQIVVEPAAPAAQIEEAAALQHPAAGTGDPATTTCESSSGKPIILPPGPAADTTTATDDDAQRRQRTAGSYMRVSSVANEIEHADPFIVDSVILRDGDDLYAVPRNVMDEFKLTIGTRIVYATTDGAVPDPLTVIGNYNLVEFDRTYFGIPHGIPVDWDDLSTLELASIIKCKSAKQLIDSVREVTGIGASQGQSDKSVERGSGPAGVISPVPQLLKSVEGYNLVTYEGWIYGIPQSLGPIDLEQEDVMDIPEVIRDVSEDVVESEIYARIRDHGPRARGDAPAQSLLGRSLREFKAWIAAS
jgi:hypothetical protein